MRLTSHRSPRHETKQTGAVRCRATNQANPSRPVPGDLPPLATPRHATRHAHAVRSDPAPQPMPRRPTLPAHPFQATSHPLASSAEPSRRAESPRDDPGRRDYTRPSTATQRPETNHLSPNRRDDALHYGAGDNSVLADPCDLPHRHSPERLANANPPWGQATPIPAVPYDLPTPPCAERHRRPNRPTPERRRKPDPRSAQRQAMPGPLATCDTPHHSDPSQATSRTSTMRRAAPGQAHPPRHLRSILADGTTRPESDRSLTTGPASAALALETKHAPPVRLATPDRNKPRRLSHPSRTITTSQALASRSDKPYRTSPMRRASPLPPLGDKPNHANPQRGTCLPDPCHARRRTVPDQSRSIPCDFPRRDVTCHATKQVQPCQRDSPDHTTPARSSPGDNPGRTRATTHPESNHGDVPSRPMACRRDFPFRSAPVQATRLDGPICTEPIHGDLSHQLTPILRDGPSHTPPWELQWDLRT
jgi:hypothetical protein